MRSKIRLLLVLIALLFGSVVSVRAGSDCYNYPNSQPFDFGLPYGAECVGLGNGCSQCVYTGDPYYQDEVCVFGRDMWSGDYYCTSFGSGGWENQIP